MKSLKNTLLATAAAAAMGLGMPGIAQANTFASAILLINNFKLLHAATGIPFAPGDFSTLRGTNDAHATAERNGIPSSAFDSIDILLPPPSLLHQCVGTCQPKLNNDFTKFLVPPAVSFGYADQDLDGTSLSALGATARTRADASTTSSPTQASGNSDVGTSTTFAFSVLAPDAMRVSFTAIPYLQAFVSPGSQPNTNANARLSWHINIRDLTTDSELMSESPDELNQARSRTDGAPGTSTYDPLPLVPFSFTTNALLAVGHMYQLTVEHNTLANVLQDERLPEPGTLAALAAGLLSMSLISRRRKL
jgi:hypothetical protein